MAVNRNEMPTDGWQFRLAATRWFIKNPKDITFREAVAQIQGHIAANPGLRLASDFDSCAQMLEEYTLALPKNARFRDRPAPVELPAQKKSPLGAVVAAGVRRLRNDLRGVATLAQWSLRDGGKPVQIELAKKRATVCAGCQFNQLNNGFEQRIAEFIRREHSARRQMNLTLPNDHLLKSCTACGCDLKLKVWTPLEHIDTSKDALEELPPHCWVSTESLPPSDRTVVLQRGAAFGDVIQASVIADRLAEMGYHVQLNTKPVIREIFENHPSIEAVTEDTGDVNLDNTYEREPHTKHIQEQFHAAAKKQLELIGIDLGPFWQRVPELATLYGHEAFEKMKGYQRPWVVIIPSSYAFGNRCLPEPVWQSAAKFIKGTVFNAGVATFAAPIVNLKSNSFSDLLKYLYCADVVATVDTGPMHAAAALRKPIVAVEQAFRIGLRLNDLTDWTSVAAPIDCIGCAKHRCPIDEKAPPCHEVDPLRLATAINRKVNTLNNGLVSAIIPVYKPDNRRLTRCIESVQGQVKEVILSCDAGCRTDDYDDENVRTVYGPNLRTGFGKTCNRGARQSIGEWILFLNDDCYLEPDAVEKMLEAADESTGVVGCLTRYPDGTIYHAGTVVFQDGIQYGHRDHGKTKATISCVTEMDFVNFAAALVRRKAFYEVGAFDARFDCYSEDADLCLKLRKAGWKVVYQPAAEGIHEESKSTSSMKAKMLEEGRLLLLEKWLSERGFNA